MSLQLPPGWTQEIDESNGRPYYFNSQSGESSWVVPGEEFSVSWDNSGVRYWIDRNGNTYPFEE